MGKGDRPPGLVHAAELDPPPGLAQPPPLVEAPPGLRPPKVPSSPTLQTESARPYKKTLKSRKSAGSSSDPGSPAKGSRAPLMVPSPDTSTASRSSTHSTPDKRKHSTSPPVQQSPPSSTPVRKSNAPYSLLLQRAMESIQQQAQLSPPLPSPTPSTTTPSNRSQNSTPKLTPQSAPKSATACQSQSSPPSAPRSLAPSPQVTTPNFGCRTSPSAGDGSAPNSQRTPLYYSPREPWWPARDPDSFQGPLVSATVLEQASTNAWFVEPLFPQIERTSTASSHMFAIMVEQSCRAAETHIGPLLEAVVTDLWRDTSDKKLMDRGLPLPPFSTLQTTLQVMLALRDDLLNSRLPISIWRRCDVALQGIQTLEAAPGSLTGEKTQAIQKAIKSILEDFGKALRLPSLLQQGASRQLLAFIEKVWDKVDSQAKFLETLVKDCEESCGLVKQWQAAVQAA